MRLVMGIDPGAKGAMAVYDIDRQKLAHVWDMPIFMQTIGRTKKPRVNVPALCATLETARDMGVEMAVMEQVGGRPKQSAVHAFTFGWSCGIVYALLVQNRIAVDNVRPSVWKQIMRCKTELSDIHARACEVFPGEEARWTGPKGAIRDGRCEAALMALFAANHSFGRVRPGAEDRAIG